MLRTSRSPPDMDILKDLMNVLQPYHHPVVMAISTGMATGLKDGEGGSQQIKQYKPDVLVLAFDPSTQ